jgi:hypothetical protein
MRGSRRDSGRVEGSLEVCDLGRHGTGILDSRSCAEYRPGIEWEIHGLFEISGGWK